MLKWVREKNNEKIEVIFDGFKRYEIILEI